MIFFQKQVQIVNVFTYEVDLPFDSSTGLSTATKKRVQYCYLLNG